MPTYEYECEACQHRFEEFQSIKADPLTDCPACGKKALNRLLGTGAGFIFKGSGFYITDYRSEGYKKAAKAESESAKTTSGDSSSSSSTSSSTNGTPKSTESSGTKASSASS